MRKMDVGSLRKVQEIVAKD
uniref:Uncharacterized protein n=1 Tax=Rhizophora mucronata TaxID=61149 RepID=A0A2P2PSP8_RHIMU